MILYGTIGAAFVGSVISMLFILLKTRWIFSLPVNNAEIRRISKYIADGAMTFLSREYKILTWFVLFVSIFLLIGQSGPLKWGAASFLLGAICSGLAGFCGMKVATAANARTCEAAQTSMNNALRVAFSGGAVMGMSVTGLALFGIAAVLLGCVWFWPASPQSSVELLNSYWLPILSGFSLGASSIALFARVGGGIFTKAADVGADLVGKVEAGIPEDDPRNPATIADNVGDNVGDVAGMGADLFESYVGSIVGSMILGASLISASDDMRLRLTVLPLLLAAMGVLASVIGIRLVNAKEGQSPQGALNTGSFGAAFLAAVASYPICYYLLGAGEVAEGITANSIYAASIIGLASGVAIGLLTEYFTGTGKRPVLAIVKACETGAATTIITGMGMGMLSTVLPILVICAAILASHAMAGFYGIGIAALGMLVTLGVQLAVDAYGPIADNAGGLAEMAELPPEVREITDSLDAVGNTTAAIGKGFAIGSAALTAIILFSAFREQAGASVINLTEPLVLVGIMLGAMIPYLFSALAMMAVGRAAFAMINEVRRQFRTIPGVLEGTTPADHMRCIDISTQAAIKEMVLPGILAILSPVLVGFWGGIGMLTGLLTGVTVSGVVLAIFMSNSGGAWDNAKKMIEGGASGGKGSEAHRASVVGDTVGDPFKDTAGPALNILIKVMAVISLVIAPMLKDYWS